MKLQLPARFTLVFAACMVISLGWFVVSVKLGDSKDAGLGGDMAVAIALFCLFINPDLVDALKGPKASLKEVLNDLLGSSDGQEPAESVKKLRAGVEKLVRALVKTSDDRYRENKYLALASAVGVIVGAFGERAAELILRLLGH
jgi:hypothetical protein